MSRTENQKWLWLWFLLAIVTYILPWVGNVPSGLTMAAYDFAHFLSKITLYDTRVYYTVFLLRGQLFLLTAFLVLGASRPFFTLDWWARGIIGLFLIVAQLPPLNLLGAVANDLNPQQQLIWAGLSFIVLVIGMTGIFWRFRYLFWGILSLMAIVSSIFGLFNGLSMMQAYQLPANLGFGAVAYVLLWTLLGLWLVRRYYLTTRKETGSP